MLKYFLAIFVVFFLLLLNIFENKFSKKILFTLKSILTVLLFEITIFNINSYRVDLGNFKYTSFSGKNLTKRIENTFEGDQYISIEDLNMKVKSIYIKIDKLDEDKIINYDIYYSDDSTSNRYLASKEYCQGVEKTKYSTISLSRKLQKYLYKCKR